MNIAWGITGAGYMLEESIVAIGKLVNLGVNVTCFISKAGFEVLKMYGLLNVVRKHCPGNYLHEVFTDYDEGASSPHAARLTLKIYRLLVISPASSNTIAKIVNGISDTLVTNAFMNACKAGIKVLIVPSESSYKHVKSKTPISVNRTICMSCTTKCPPSMKCPTGAFTLSNIDKLPSLKLTLCEGCKICVEACPYGAVSFGLIVSTRTRKIDIENIKKIKSMKNVKVFKNPFKVVDFIKYYR
ncbi:MAG: flavoprotein [Candidatus Methanomethylicia archaeon]